MMKEKLVIVLSSGKSLDRKEFSHYIKKKILKTARKLNLKKADFNKNAVVYCLDDAAVEIISSLMLDKKSSVKKSPFFFCLKKELELYAKLKKIKFGFIKHCGLKLKISKMLDEFEKKHPEIKHSIVNAQLK